MYEHRYYVKTPRKMFLDGISKTLPKKLSEKLAGLSSFWKSFNSWRDFYVGNQSVSVAGYSNNITYWANNNLRLNANILLYQPAINALGNQNNGPKIALDAGLIYQPTKNTFLQINFKNLPNYGLNNNLYRRKMPNNNGFGVY